MTNGWGMELDTDRIATGENHLGASRPSYRLHANVSRLAMHLLCLEEGSSLAQLHAPRLRGRPVTARLREDWDAWYRISKLRTPLCP